MISLNMMPSLFAKPLTLFYFLIGNFSICIGQNVGIGTTTPARKLHIAGGLRVDTLIGAGTRVVRATAQGDVSAIPSGSVGDALIQTNSGPAWQPLPDFTNIDKIIPIGHLASTYIFQQTYIDNDYYMRGGGIGLEIILESHDTIPQQYSATAVWPTANAIRSVVILGDYLYAQLSDGSSLRVYRFDRKNLAAGGTLMTFNGQAIGGVSISSRMTCDGTNFYFSYQAGNSPDDFRLSKYALSGTSFNFIGNTQYGNTPGSFQFFAVRPDTTVFGIGGSPQVPIKKFAANGASIYQFQNVYSSSGGLGLLVKKANIYVGSTSLNLYSRLELP